jgi:hypothetical protein
VSGGYSDDEKAVLRWLAAGPRVAHIDRSGAGKVQAAARQSLRRKGLIQAAENHRRGWRLTTDGEIAARALT